ncbi:hypothetical protein [Rahnella bonaserana]|uniref:Chemotaxis protein n=1 Tax=Rahnella bonaserana TaxID=2816248 RepID=A0ABS6LZ76_9GAMM|nr:hypothetical protein [Rahnella bonaserana]MBU9857356.1 hypothetical protein [Rahnella bonaserana]
MRLILKQYISSLRERDELDAILPDLLSQMGMIVTSTPGRGTKQNGVDIAAIKKSSKQEDITYLFSIKAGDLTRTDWSGPQNQALRPSLDEIKDSYLNSKLSKNQRKGKITICLCFGGVINETIQADVNGYIKNNTTENINYEIWNGDHLAQLIMTHLLNESLLPEPIRKNLRKSLAMIDDPESSVMYFRDVIKGLLLERKKRKGDVNKNTITLLRQISLCLWILHSWSRDLKNIESAYLSSELCILACWDIVKEIKESKVKQNINEIFHKIIDQYLILNNELLVDKISPLADFRDGVSLGVYPHCKYAINFKVYDVIGRFATYGIWLIWTMRENYEAELPIDDLAHRVHLLQATLAKLIINNSSVYLPFKDENSIELALAIYFLSLDSQYDQLVKDWIHAITERITYSFETNRNYPRTLFKYLDFLDKNNHEEYKKEVTKASVLYSYLAFFASLFNDINTYESLQNLKLKHLSHTNIQIWFPSVQSEEFYYNGERNHGLALSNIPIHKEAECFLDEIVKEAKVTKGYEELSVIRSDYLPILFLASRVNRFPVPLMAFVTEFEEEIDLRTNKESSFD